VVRHGVQEINLTRQHRALIVSAWWHPAVLKAMRAKFFQPARYNPLIAATRLPQPTGNARGCARSARACCA